MRAKTVITISTVATDHSVTGTKLLNEPLRVSLAVTSPVVVYISQIVSLYIKTLCNFALQSKRLMGIWLKSLLCGCFVVLRQESSVRASVCLSLGELQVCSL